MWYCARVREYLTRECIGNYKNWNQVDDDNQERVQKALWRRGEDEGEKEARRYANYIIIMLILIMGGVVFGLLFNFLPLVKRW